MLDNLPYEVLETIAFWAANNRTYGCSPSALITFFSLNRTIRNCFIGDPNHGIRANNALLHRLFEQHFDKEAFERRCHVKLDSPNLAAEYKKRICVLRHIRNNEYTVDDLWTVLLMIYEDDGKNMKQLLDVNVQQWATAILLQTPSDVDGDGWPLESEQLRLSAAILSLVSTTESVLRESSDTRLAILDTLHPFLFGSHRYSASHIPLTHHFVNARHATNTVDHSLLRLVGSMFIHNPSIVSHFGYTLTLACPRIVESALCATNLRMERVDNPVSSSIPVDRAAADSLGFTGATQADYRENNYHRRLALGSEVPHAGSAKEQENRACLPNPLTGSKRFDVDFHRLLYALDGFKLDDLVDRWVDHSWYNTLYIPGLLTGNWIGRYQVPRWDGFMQMVQSHPAPLPSVDGYELFDVVMQVSLREYVATDSDNVVGCGDEEFGDGLTNAWWPNGVDPSRGVGVYQTAAELVIRDPYEDQPQWEMKRYVRYHEGLDIPEAWVRQPPRRVEEEQQENNSVDSGSHSSEDVEQQGSSSESNSSGNSSHQIPEDVAMDFHEEHMRNGGQDMRDCSCVDIIVTGETDNAHGRAWGDYVMYGRVRRNDGLITLLRVPANNQVGQGRWIFSGYLRASTILVGQWREGTTAHGSGYAGPFMLTKVGESWAPPMFLPPVVTASTAS